MAKLAAGRLTSRSQTSQAQLLKFVVHDENRKFIWVVIQCFQVVIATQLSLLAWMYFALGLSANSLLGYISTCFLTTQDQQYLESTSTMIAVGYAVGAAAFWYSSAAMVIMSIRSRVLQFENSIRWRPGQHRQNTRQWSSLVHQGLDTARQWWWRRIASSFWIDFGVRGKYFEIGNIGRETVEMALQTMQAYNVSRVISSRVINLGYGVLILLNALLQPVLRRKFDHRASHKRRLWTVFSDFLLDITWGIALPLLIVLPYASLDSSAGCGALLFTRGLGFIEKTQRELQVVVVMSLQSFVLSAFPFVGAWVNLHSVKSLLIHASRSDTTRKPEPVMVPQQHLSTSTLVSSAISMKGHRGSRLVHAVHAIMIAFGVGLFVVILAADRVRTRQSSSSSPLANSADEECLFPISPWFTSKTACTTWVIDCATRGVKGEASELTPTLEYVHQDVVAAVAIFNCDELEIPASLGNFQSVLSLSIWNSYISKWTRDVVPTKQRLPLLQTLVIQNSTLNSDLHQLQGLVSGEVWSGNIERVILDTTDVRHLVSSVTREWEAIRRWQCVSCGILEFPSMLVNSDLLREIVVQNTNVTDFNVDMSQRNRSLQVTDTRNSSLSQDVAQLWPQLESLKFDSNPLLVDLGDVVWRRIGHAGHRHLTINIAETNISTIPEFMTDFITNQSLVLNATGSPLCRNSMLSSSSTVCS